MDLTYLFISVASIWCVAVITPGPNLFITLQASVKGSRLAGLYVVLGTCTGTVFWSMAGFFGIAYLFDTFPWMYTLLKVLGGSYILWLGVLSIRNSRKYSDESDGPKHSPQNLHSDYWKGLITNLSNPKTAMFITSLFASVLPKEPTFHLGIMMAALMVVISFVWYSFVVLLFSSKKISDGYGKTQAWIEGFAGIIFIFFGARLVFGSR